MLAADTEWPQRLMLTAAVVAMIVVCLALMRRGWVHRAERQLDVPEPPIPPDLPRASASHDVTDVSGRYLGATRAGDWLDRVVVHGLGVPTSLRVSVRTRSVSGTPTGLWLDRDGAPSIFVPSSALLGARHDRGAAGRAYEAGGVLVVTCRLGAVALDLGVRVRDPESAERLRLALDAIDHVHAPASMTPGDPA